METTAAPTPTADAHEAAANPVFAQLVARGRAGASSQRSPSRSRQG